MALALFVTVSCGLVACSFLQDLDYLQSGSDGGIEGAVDAAVDNAVSEGAVCPPDGRYRPARFFEYLPEIADGEAPQASTCDLGDVLDADGKLAKLDRTRDGSIGRGFIGGVPVAGCVAVEFDSQATFSSVVIRLGRVADACGSSPCQPDGGCESTPGLQAFVFAGTSTKDLRSVGNPRFLLALEDQVVALPPGSPQLSLIVVCRGGNVSATRDDVGVDAIWATCR